MLMNAILIPSPPPIGSSVGDMVVTLLLSGPRAMPTMVSKAMLVTMAADAPASSPTRTAFVSTNTLNVGAVTSQPK